MVNVLIATVRRGTNATVNLTCWGAQSAHQHGKHVNVVTSDGRERSFRGVILRSWNDAEESPSLSSESAFM